MNSREFEKDMQRVWLRIARCAGSVSLYLSASGHPTFVAGVGCILVGVYTSNVSLRQIQDDIAEADRERRRGNH